ncbi:MAG TPA: 16S rRNA (cytosine(967)-C(5))-methyltransferase RsmB [Casimicrobiaceae bacterium]
MRIEQQQAARVVESVQRGIALDAALAAVDDGSPLRGRALVQELAYGTLRHWGTLDALTRHLASKPVTEPLLHALVSVALYQLDYTRAPAFAVVDRAVEAAADLSRPAAKRWVNALLRRYLREKDVLASTVRRDPVARWSYPRWWIARIKADFPAAWESILEAGNARPPLTLRVNHRVATRQDLMTAFAEQAITCAPVGERGVIVDPPRSVTELPGFAEGAFSVQDLAAQLAAPLLDVSDGMRVLDACAAPGGKTAHLLELADVAVTAVDRDDARVQRLSSNLRRLNLSDRSVQVVHGDALEPSAWWDARPYDRILADVPCSASGVVRRHPDVKWLRRPGDIAAFVRDQDRILDALWPLLSHGGMLLYATCSLFKAENEERVAEFLTRHADALRETIMFPPDAVHIEGQLLPSPSAAVHNQDGFFYALLRKA